jgi:hypothetical protein
MALTDAQYKSLIILQCGDTANGTLATNIDLLWDKNDDRADLGTRFLYTKRDAIDVLTDLMKHLQMMRDDVERLIDEQAQIANAPAIADIETTAPIMPPDFWPDANDPRYKGDPYQPRPPQIGRTPS